MACREEELVLLANGRLGAFAAWKAQRHVKGCAACQSALRELTALGAALQAVAQAEPSEALDYRIASRRYEAPSRLASLSVVWRFAAPIIGLILGLLYGGLTVTRTVVRQVQATATIPVLTAPSPQDWTDAKRMIDLLQRKRRTMLGDATSWIRQREVTQKPEIAVSFTTYLEDSPRKEIPMAVDALKDWSSALKSSPELKALGWQTGEIQQVKWKVLASPDRSNDVLMWGLVGLGLGCVFWGLRWIGGWLPGGLPVAVGIGIILSLGMAVVPQVTKPSVWLKTTLQFSKISGTLTIDEFEQCHAMIGYGQGTGPVAYLVRRSMNHKNNQVVLQYSSTCAPALAERAVQKWVDDFQRSKALRLCGYAVTVVEPVTIESPLEQGKSTILPFLGLGIGAGLIMGLFRRR